MHEKLMGCSQTKPRPLMFCEYEKKGAVMLAKLRGLGTILPDH